MDVNIVELKNSETHTANNMPYQPSSANRSLLKKIVRSVTKLNEPNRRFNFEVTVPTANTIYHNRYMEVLREV